MINDSVEHPAADFCRSVKYNEFDDYYLPAVNELELCYRTFKPTLDKPRLDLFNGLVGFPYESIGRHIGYNPVSYPAGSEYEFNNINVSKNELFLVNNKESFVVENEYFDLAQYWSSTQSPVNKRYAYYQRFKDGLQHNVADKRVFRYLRAVRREVIKITG